MSGTGVRSRTRLQHPCSFLLFSTAVWNETVLASDMQNRVIFTESSPSSLGCGWVWASGRSLFRTDGGRVLWGDISRVWVPGLCTCLRDAYLGSSTLDYLFLANHREKIWVSISFLCVEWVCPPPQSARNGGRCRRNTAAELACTQQPPSSFPKRPFLTSR